MCDKKINWRYLPSTASQRHGLYRWGLPPSLIRQFNRGEISELYNLLTKFTDRLTCEKEQQEKNNASNEDSRGD